MSIENNNIVTISAELIPETPSLTLARSVLTPASFPSITQGVVDCRDDERQLINDAYKDLNTVISSEPFKGAVLASVFTESNSLESSGVYELFVAQSPVTVDFTMYSGGIKDLLAGTMGYEDPDNPTVCFANRKKVREKEVCASLILHETMHILGFSHYGEWSTSVPYSMNQIYDRVAKSLGLEPTDE